MRIEVSEDIMTRLRRETALHHERAEQGELERNLAAGTLGREVFVRLLGQRYHVHRALERLVRQLVREHPAVGLVIQEQLFQEANLRSDLEFFGVRTEEVPTLDSTRRLIGEMERLAQENALALLGCYYVFEGSKNGARYIARRLREALGLERDGLRYMDPHGDMQRELWMKFKSRMSAAPFTSEEKAAMIEAAKSTFDGIAAIDAELHATSASGV